MKDVRYKIAIAMSEVEDFISLSKYYFYKVKRKGVISIICTDKEPVDLDNYRRVAASPSLKELNKYFKEKYNIKVGFIKKKEGYYPYYSEGSKETIGVIKFKNKFDAILETFHIILLNKQFDKNS